MDKSFRETFRSIKAEVGDKSQLKPLTAFENVQGIVGTPVFSTLGLFGIDEPEVVTRFRRFKPVTSTVLDFAGVGGAYVGAYKGLSKIKKLENAISNIGDASKSPIKTIMLQEAARASAIESGRLGVSQIIGNTPFGDDAATSAVNVLAGTALVGGFKALAQGGDVIRVTAKIFEGIDLDAPPQKRYRQLKEQLDSGALDPKKESVFKSTLARTEQEVRNAEAKTYVSKLAKGDAKAVSRLFNFRAKPSHFYRRKFAQSQDQPGTFKTTSEYQNILQQNLPEGFAGYAQYPRHLSFGTDGSAANIRATIKSNFENVGDGWYLTREADDGAYVMAKKIAGEEKATAADQWIVFKTQNPNFFMQESGVFKQAVEDHIAFISKDADVTGPVSPIYDTLKGFLDDTPLEAVKKIDAAKGSPAEIAARINKLLKTDKFVKGHGESLRRLGDVWTEYLTPTVHQTARSPRAQLILAAGRATKDAAENLQKEILFGKATLDKSKPAANYIFSKGAELEGKGAIKTHIDKLTDDEVKEFWSLVRNEIGGENLVKLWEEGKISNNTFEFAKFAEEVDAKIVQMIQAQEAARGNKKLVPKVGHFGLSRGWEGDQRIVIRGDDGKAVAMASGFTRKQAQQNAQKLSKRLEDEGITNKIAEELDLTSDAKIPSDVSPILANPAFTIERQNIRGFKYDTEPFTKKELLQEYISSVTGRTKYLQNMATYDLLADQLAKLSIEDPLMHKIAVGRLNDLQGIMSPAARAQNQVVDRVLGHLVGKNSATKIVSATNSALWHLELGALRLSYPALNALTFMQTVVPEASFVLGASPEVLSKYYTTSAVHGAVSRPFYSLDPMKIWWQATRTMHSKDEAFTNLVQRGINEGVLDPKFVEEWAGESSAKVREWREILKGPEGFLNWTKAASEALPAASEKWSRLNAFATGYRMGKDILKITDDEMLYRFARDFTDRTMFRYGQDARARIFTTPAGSAFGVFKNWMTHYIGMMGDYAQEGFVKNNWGPLLWQTAGTAAIGGATALPLYSIANGLSKAMSDKSLLVNGYDAFSSFDDEKNFSDAVFFGLPAALTGVSLSSQAEAPLSNPMRDATMLFGMVHQDRINAAGRAMETLFGNWLATGEHPARDANVRDQLARAFAPKTMYRTFAAAEENAIRSLNSSYPIIKDVSLGDRLAFAFGFNPVELEKAYEISGELWNDKNKMRNTVRNYGQAAYDMYVSNDTKGLKKLMAKALAEGVPLDSIERSVTVRLRNAEEEVYTRNFKDEEIEKRMTLFARQDQ